MQGLLATIRSLGIVRVAVIAALTLAAVGGMAVLEFWGAAAPRMAELAVNLDAQETQDLIRTLDSARLKYRYDPQTRQVLVAETDLAAARALHPLGSGLGAATGAAGSAGYEIFDNGGMLLTEFEQQVRLTRALEGELSRTIVSVRGIQRARVHLVLPHRQPFEQRATEAQASVMLTLSGRGSLSAEAVRSVVDLVAAAVPGLRPGAITVVDSNLHLLVQAGDRDMAHLNGQHADELRNRMETRLAQAVELMLERSLGIGHVHAEASVALNFDKVNEKQERYDPDSSAVRSTQAVTTNNKSTEKTPSVSVQNNLPNADAGATTAGTQEAKQEETTNYEITRSVREIVHDQPHIDRLSMAVLVDGTDEVDAAGKHTWKPRAQAELDQIRRLVKSAVGFDEKRGDTLEIASMPFAATTEVQDQVPVPPPVVSVNRTGELASFVQLITFSAVGLITIVLTARSILTHLAQPPTSYLMPPEAAAGPALALGTAAGALPAPAAPPGASAGAPPGAALGSPAAVPLLTEGWEDPDDPYEAATQLSSVRRVEDLLDKDPDGTRRVLEEWLRESAGEIDAVLPAPGGRAERG